MISIELYIAIKSNLKEKADPEMMMMMMMKTTTYFVP